MNNPVIVADAGPLIAFGRLDFLSILTKTLGSIIIPTSVANECMEDKSRPGARAIDYAIHKQVIVVRADPITEQFTQLHTLLGRGESAAIALAFELQAGYYLSDSLISEVAKMAHESEITPSALGFDLS